MALLGVKGVLEMIVSHRALSSLNMSSYRTIWTHFKPNSMILILKLFGSWSWTRSWTRQPLDLDLGTGQAGKLVGWIGWVGGGWVRQLVDSM